MPLVFKSNIYFGLLMYLYYHHGFFFFCNRMWIPSNCIRANSSGKRVKSLCENLPLTVLPKQLFLLCPKTVLAKPGEMNKKVFWEQEHRTLQEFLIILQPTSKPSQSNLQQTDALSNCHSNHPHPPMAQQSLAFHLKSTLQTLSNQQEFADTNTNKQAEQECCYIKSLAEMCLHVCNLHSNFRKCHTLEQNLKVIATNDIKFLYY